MDSPPREVVIDLGSYHYRPDGEPEYDPPWPGFARLRRLRPWRWLPAALAVLLAVPLAGAAGAARPALELRWSPPLHGGDEMFRAALADEMLYVPADTGEGWALTAYRLADGQVAWHAPLPASVGEAYVQLAGDTPMVTVYGRQTAGDGYTTAYDPGTGRELWSHPGDPREQFGDWLVLDDRPTPDEFTMTAVAVATGETAGLLRLPESEQVRTVWRSPAGALEVFTLHWDGQLTRYDLASGELRASVATGYEEELNDSTQNGVMVIDGVLAVLDHGSPNGTFATFDPVTLAPSWTAPSAGDVIGCGPVICVWRHGIERTLIGLDPATGEPRWSLSCRDCEGMLPALLPGDQLLLEIWPPMPGTGEPAARSWLVDARTGERLTEPIEWQRLFTADLSEPLLLVRAEGESSTDADGPPPRTWFALADAGLTSVTVLGVIEAEICLPRLPYLLCGSEDAPSTVLRVNA